MFRRAVSLEGVEIFAKDAKAKTLYFCPGCKEEVFVVKDSEHKQDHFSHKKNSFCGYTDGAIESDEHKQAKKEIYNSIAHKLGEGSVSVEERLPDGQRPDVFFELPSGEQIAIEIQRSHISENDWDDRVSSYTNKKISSLWLLNDMRKHIIGLDTIRGSAVLNLPSWMRRIARRFDGAAFDTSPKFSNDGLLLSVNLQLRSELVKDALTKKWYYQEQIDSWYHDPVVGLIYKIKSPEGHTQSLWMPKRLGRSEVSNRRARKTMGRREDEGGVESECLKSSDFRDIFNAIKSRRDAIDAYLALYQKQQDVGLSNGEYFLAQQIISRWGDKK